MYSHCRQRKYSFAIRECEGTNSCPVPTRLHEGLLWLPDQFLNETGLHYKKYENVKNCNTTENDLPNKQGKKEHNPAAKPFHLVTEVYGDNVKCVMSGQTA